MIQQEYYCSFEAGLVGSYYGAAMRKLEEARLTMTIQANFSLIKRGYSIETAPIEDIVINKL